MREGPDEELRLTENAQPAIMAHSIAVLRTLEVSLPEVASFVAGHSLGEYVAACLSGVFSLEDALALVVPGKAPYSTVAEMLQTSKTRGLSLFTSTFRTSGPDVFDLRHAIEGVCHELAPLLPVGLH